MSDHSELVAEMVLLEQLPAQERLRLAHKRRLKQLQSWIDYEDRLQDETPDTPSGLEPTSKTRNLIGTESYPDIDEQNSSTSPHGSPLSNKSSSYSDDQSSSPKNFNSKTSNLFGIVKNRLKGNNTYNNEHMANNVPEAVPVGTPRPKGKSHQRKNSKNNKGSYSNRPSFMSNGMVAMGQNNQSDNYNMEHGDLIPNNNAFNDITYRTSLIPQKEPKQEAPSKSQNQGDVIGQTPFGQSDNDDFNPGNHHYYFYDPDEGNAKSGDQNYSKPRAHDNGEFGIEEIGDDNSIGSEDMLENSERNDYSTFIPDSEILKATNHDEGNENYLTGKLGGPCQRHSYREDKSNKNGNRSGAFVREMATNCQKNDEEMGRAPKHIKPTHGSKSDNSSSVSHKTNQGVQQVMSNNKGENTNRKNNENNINKNNNRNANNNKVDKSNNNNNKSKSKSNKNVPNQNNIQKDSAQNFPLPSNLLFSNGHSDSLFVSDTDQNCLRSNSKAENDIKDTGSFANYIDSPEQNNIEFTDRSDAHNTGAIIIENSNQGAMDSKSQVINNNNNNNNNSYSNDTNNTKSCSKDVSTMPTSYHHRAGTKHVTASGVRIARTGAGDGARSTPSGGPVARKAHTKAANIKRAKRGVQFSPGIVLLEAASRNDLDEVKTLLENGIDPNVSNADGLTALHQCCIDDYYEMVELLIDHGANIDACDTELWTPLHAAATCGHANLIKLFADRGANLLSLNADGNMPYDMCEDEYALDILETEMSNKGITQEDIDVARTVPEKKMLADLKQIKEDLTAKGGKSAVTSRFEARDIKGATPLHIACANGYQPVVEFLLANDVYVNCQDNDLWTPLHAAAFWGHPSVIECLINKDADIEAKNKDGETPIDICEDPEIKERLLDIKTELEQNKIFNSKNIWLHPNHNRISNRRNSSIRRSSIRDKTALSRREIIEEAKLRQINNPSLNEADQERSPGQADTNSSNKYSSQNKSNPTIEIIVADNDSPIKASLAIASNKGLKDHTDSPADHLVAIQTAGTNSTTQSGGSANLNSNYFCFNFNEGRKEENMGTASSNSKGLESRLLPDLKKARKLANEEKMAAKSSSLFLSADSNIPSRQENTIKFSQNNHDSPTMSSQGSASPNIDATVAGDSKSRNSDDSGRTGDTNIEPSGGGVIKSMRHRSARTNPPPSSSAKDNGISETEKKKSLNGELGHKQDHATNPLDLNNLSPNGKGPSNKTSRNSINTKGAPKSGLKNKECCLIQ